jgi:pimeloyl-ACP methyl ester carboxylesterase
MRSLKLLLGILMALLWVTSAVAQADAPFVTPAECPIDVPANPEIGCGLLSVPENYDQPEGRWIQMPYIWIESPTADSDAVPLIFTEGGPGGNSLHSVWRFAESILLEDRDIIIFQQRGNFHADPDLTCEIEEFYDEAIGTSPCLEKFKIAGIDLTQYHTSVLARDIESLRVALEIDQWNFFGSSYSTKLGQVLLESYPEGLRSVILQSVAPLDVNKFEHDPVFSQRVLSLMFDTCEADPVCAAAYPDLEGRFYNLVGKLNREPMDLKLENDDGSTFPYQVNGATLISWMVGHSFYGPTHPPYSSASLPLLIDAASKGDLAILQSWAQWEVDSQFLGPDFFSLGLYLVVTCQDEYDPLLEAFYTSQENQYPQLEGYLRYWNEWQICQLWDLPKSPPLGEEPLSSEIPALVLAGSFDPVTPPGGSRRIAEKLENATYIEFPSKGHSIDDGTDCGMIIKRSFLQDPWSEPDTSCLVDEPPPTFLVPDDLVSIDGVVLSVEDINFGIPDQGKLGFEILAGASLGFFITEILVFMAMSVVLMVKWSERRKKARSFSYQLHVIAVIVAVLTIAMVFLISAMNPKYVWNNELLNSIGYFQTSVLSTILGLTVLVQMVFCMLLLVYVVLMWIKKQSKLINRIFLTLLILAGFYFWVFFIRWDLLQLL